MSHKVLYLGFVMTKTYKSDLSSVIHETASNLFEYGVLNKVTMKEFGTLCLILVGAILPEEIRVIHICT